MQPIQTAFFSGTFNPVHTGHLILASYLCEYEGFDEVWISVTPQNPLREKLSPEADRQRIEMLRLAVTGNPKIVVTDVEFSLPLPSYTIRSLDHLRSRYPDREFTLVIGADNWLLFDRWYESRRIVDEYHVCIYPRRGYEIDETKLPPTVRYCRAPLIEISSTQVRAGIAAGKNMNYFVPQSVYNYIIKHGLYKNNE